MRRTWRWGTASGESLCPSVVIAPAFRQFHCCEVTTGIESWSVENNCVSTLKRARVQVKILFSRRFHVKLKGYIHRSIDSYNTYIYLYKRYWYFHIYIYALATNYICREMQSKPRRHRIRCFLRKILFEHAFSAHCKFQSRWNCE